MQKLFSRYALALVALAAAAGAAHQPGSDRAKRVYGLLAGASWNDSSSDR